MLGASDFFDSGREKATAWAVFVTCLLFMAVVGSYFVMKEYASDSAKMAAYLLISVGAVGVFISCLMRPSLFALLYMLAMVFSPRIPVGRVPGRIVELRLEDFVFFAMCVWLFLRLCARCRVVFPIFKPVVLYLALALVSTGFGIAAGRVPQSRALFFWLRDVEYIGLMFLFANLFEDRDELLAALRWSLAVALVVPIWVLWQTSLGGFGGYVAVSFPLDVPGRAQIGGFCLVFGVLSLVWWFEARNPRARFFLLASFGAHLAAVVAAASRTYFAGIMIAALLVLFGAFRRAAVPARALRPLAAAVLLSVAMGWLLPGSFLGLRLGQAARAFAGPGGSGAAALGQRYRLPQKWIGGLSGVTTLFIGRGKGSGPGGRASYDVNPIADSSYGRITGETGILGMLAFLGVLTVLFLRARAATRPPERRGLPILARSMEVLVPAYALCSIFVEPFYATKSAEPFWMLAGLMFAAVRISELETQGAGELEPQPSAGPLAKGQKF